MSFSNLRTRSHSNISYTCGEVKYDFTLPPLPAIFLSCLLSQHNTFSQKAWVEYYEGPHFVFCFSGQPGQCWSSNKEARRLWEDSWCPGRKNELTKPVCPEAYGCFSLWCCVYRKTKRCSADAVCIVCWCLDHYNSTEGIILSFRGWFGMYLGPPDNR